MRNYLHMETGYVRVWDRVLLGMGCVFPGVGCNPFSVCFVFNMSNMPIETSSNDTTCI